MTDNHGVDASARNSVVDAEYPIWYEGLDGIVPTDAATA